MNNSKEFQKNYFETVVFNELKDAYFPGISYIRNKYGDLGIDTWNVYRRIVDYRIKKYGNSYLSDPKQTYKTKEEMMKDSQNIRKDRYRRYKGAK